MVILHIACISGDPFSGVSVVVPQHVKSQSSFAETGLLNISGKEFCGIKNVKGYVEDFKLDRLEAPFDKPDLVVFHEVYRIQYIKIYKELVKNGIPYVVLPHGELREEAQSKKKLKKTVANMLLFNSFIKKAKGLQCLSNLELESTHFNVNKFIGTNGIGLPNNHKENYNFEKTVIIYIGRLEVYPKGIDILLDAIKKEASLMRDRKCELHMYGPDYAGRFEQVKQMIADREIGDIVTLNEAIVGDEKIEKLLQADLFIQTSRHEGMPMGLLEAMSYGMPCIISEGTTLGSIMKEYDGGWVASTDSDGVASAIRLALEENEKWSIKGRNSRLAIMDNYVWEKVSEDNINQYERILRR